MRRQRKNQQIPVGARPVPENRRDVNIGDQFGHLSAASIPHYGTGHHRHVRCALFRCVCGSTIFRRIDHVRHERVASCGCKHGEEIPPATVAEKKCSACKETMPTGCFHRARFNSDNLNGKCKACVKHEGLIRQYGITLEDFERMREEQNDCCGLCGDSREEMEQRSEKKHWCVDHDHKTGKVRRLLCHRCNLLIGYAEEKAELLQKAITYIERYRTN